MVGDRWRDVEAGRQAGVRTMFIDHGYAEELTVAPDATYPDPPSAVPHLLEVTGG